MTHILRAFLEHARGTPDRPCIVDAGEVVHSYGEILSRARRFASMLQAHGVTPGDRVLLTFPNSVEYLCAYFGTLLYGVTAVLVDFRARPDHVDFVRRNCAAAAWVGPRERAAYSAIPDGLLYPEDLDRYPLLPEDRLLASDNTLALIMYTSGATGVPKGVQLTHANLDHTRRSIISWAGVQPGERELMTLSLTHLFGLQRCNVQWSLGGTVYLESGLTDIPRVLDRISRHGIVSFPGTPSGIRLLRTHFEELFRRHARMLRYSVINSAPLEVEHSRWFMDLLPGTRLFMYYGLTEASRSTSICYNDAPEKSASVGLPTPGTRIRIGTSRKGLVGEPGEILIRGPNVTPGYWNTDSSPFFDRGWFRTGDLGRIDEDGYVYWVGRLREQINVDGLKVNPLEVEMLLARHPRVRDCAVIGTPDPLKGEVVTAFVVPDQQGDGTLEIELRRFCRGQLEAYKIPARVQFIDGIPRTDSGKTKRFLLKDWLPA